MIDSVFDTNHDLIVLYCWYIYCVIDNLVKKDVAYICDILCPLHRIPLILIKRGSPIVLFVILSLPPSLVY